MQLATYFLLGLLHESPRPVLASAKLWHKPPTPTTSPVQSSLASCNLVCSTQKSYDEVSLAGGAGGALHGGAQLQRHEGGHCPGLAHQLQVGG